MSENPAVTNNSALSPIDFSVVPFSRCKQEVIDFRNVNRTVVRDQRYFDWRYSQRPATQEPLIVWARTKDGKPIGAASVIPHEYFVLDAIYPIGLLGDISILPSHRGQGIAGRMLGFLAQDHALKSLHACLVLPNDEAEGALQRAGWAHVGAIDRFIKPLNFQRLTERVVGNGRFGQLIAAGINAAMYAVSFERWSRWASIYDAKEGRSFDARYDSLWQSAASPGRILALRNSAYLSWRFSRHPNISYRTFELSRSGRLEGYVVHHQEGHFAIVDDYLVSQAETIAPLFAAFLQYLRQDKRVEMVQVRSGCAALAFPSRRLGFIKRNDRQSIMLLDPHRSGHSGPMFDADIWHVTAGDKDV